MKKLGSISAGALLFAATGLTGIAEGKAPWDTLEYRNCIDDLAAGLVLDCSGIERHAATSLTPTPTAQPRESLEYRHCQADSAAGLVFDCTDLEVDDDT